MCGITGLWGIAPRDDDATIAARMASAITHRGPDDSGVWRDGQSGVTFGFRRLAIVDLSAEGHQPMASASGRYEIVFNGEIYNFRALAAQLGAAGVRFRGHSDTEVALAAFEQWGIEESLRQFVGMFAMAVWDRNSQRLYLVRDRLGEKPLYFGVHDNTFVFASELKCLRSMRHWNPAIDRRALLLYLRHGYVPAPYTIFEGIAKVRPGTLQVVERVAGAFACREVVYWNARTVAEAAQQCEWGGAGIDPADRLEQALRDAVRDQMVADVPVGAFLSGGVDSSVVVALMQAESARPVRTFTIGFDDPAYDEAGYARAVARHLGTEHTERCVTATDALAVVARLPQIYDEPFADSSQIPTFLVSELARREVAVSLSGDGGDELFGGYPRYEGTVQLWNRIGTLPLKLRAGLGRGLQRVPARTWDRLLVPLGRWARYGGGAASGARVHRLARLFDTPSQEALYHAGVSAWGAPFPTIGVQCEYPSVLTDAGRRPALGTFLEQMMWMDAMMYLPDDLMVKVDRASMAVSLETRVPFLDHRVVELAWQLPPQERMDKAVLRRVLYRHVPRALIEREKKGFSVPIGAWLRGPLRDWAEDLLSRARLEGEGYLDADAIRAVWHDHLANRAERGAQLWPILMFQAWLGTQ